jgi:hypothetical protein
VKKLLHLLVLSIIVMSCGNPEHRRSNNPEQGFVVDPKVRLDFESVRSLVLANSCTQCHNSVTTGGNYNDFTTVRLDAQNMLREIESGTMPPLNSPPLSPSQKDLFRRWVVAGTPETALVDDTGSSDDQKALDPQALGFKDIREKVLDPYNCTACHTQYKDYETVFIDRAKILRSLENDWMPFKKSRQSDEIPEPVSAENKELLRQWIEDQNAPEVAGGTSPTVIERKLEPTWISLRNQVLGPKCILCHNSFGPRGGRDQDFGTYSELIAWQLRDENLFKLDVEPGSQPGTYLGDFMASMDPLVFSLNPMPVNRPNDDLEIHIPDVTAEELSVLIHWVELGLPHSQDD